LTQQAPGEPGHFAANRKPMIWVFPEYGGQVAVRIGDRKAVRQRLKSKEPGDWEVYNVAADRAEAHNVASKESRFIKEVETVLRQEVRSNTRFPLDIPNLDAN
jgi:arylsulfatase A